MSNKEKVFDAIRNVEKRLSELESSDNSKDLEDVKMVKDMLKEFKESPFYSEIKNS